jgi:hypothetical protein
MLSAVKQAAVDGMVSQLTAALAFPNALTDIQ